MSLSGSQAKMTVNYESGKTLLLQWKTVSNWRLHFWDSKSHAQLAQIVDRYPEKELPSLQAILDYVGSLGLVILKHSGLFHLAIGG